MAAAHLSPRPLMSAQGGRGSYMIQPQQDNSWAQLAATSTTAQASMFNNAMNAAYGLANTGLQELGRLRNTGLIGEWNFRNTTQQIPAQLAATKYTADQQLKAAELQAEAQVKAAKAQRSGGAMSGLGSLAMGGVMLATGGFK